MQTLRRGARRWRKWGQKKKWEWRKNPPKDTTTATAKWWSDDNAESNEVAKEPLEPLLSPSTCREEAEVVVKVVDV